MKNFDNINQTLRFYCSLVSSHFSGIKFLYDVLCESCQREKNNNSKSVWQSPNITVISKNKTDFGGSSECQDALRALPLDCCYKQHCKHETNLSTQLLIGYTYFTQWIRLELLLFRKSIIWNFYLNRSILQKICYLL